MTEPCALQWLNRRLYSLIQPFVSIQPTEFVLIRYVRYTKFL